MALSSYRNLTNHGRVSRLIGFIAGHLGFWGIGIGSDAGEIAIWAPHFMTEIGNSLRGVSFMVMTCEPGIYSGVFNASSETWSTPAIQFITMNLDYDGTPYPTWRGQSATLTIHSYNKRTKRINATLDAVMRMDGSSNTRNIRVDMQNMNVEGK